MNKITKSYTYYINKGATMSEEFEKKGPGTDNKAFVPEDEAKTKSFDSMVNEKMEQSDYAGYGFKEVTLKIDFFNFIQICILIQR